MWCGGLGWFQVVVVWVWVGPVGECWCGLWCCTVGETNEFRADVSGAGVVVQAAGVLTDRDLEWLRWVGRWRGVTAAQIAAWFLPEQDAGVKIAERRARVWLSHQVTRADLVLAGVPRLHNLRSAGMRLLDLDGPVRRVSVGTCRHDLAVVDLATLWHHRGRTLITEREIRAAEGSPNVKELVLTVPGLPDAGRGRLIPDLLTVHSDSTPDAPAFAAHEVEVSPKPTARVEALMLSYGASPQHRRVNYYVGDPFRSRYEKCAARVNRRIVDRGISGSEKIKVYPWVWEDANRG